jgi:hypothetical protein
MVPIGLQIEGEQGMRGYKKRERGHTIHYTLPNGRKQKLEADVWCGKHPIELRVTSADMDRSEQLRGVGTTQACMMAVCSERHASAVPFPFLMVEWTDSMAYFITEMKLGRRAKCIVYKHEDKLAAMFDSPKGRRELRKRLAAEKEIVVHLRPPQARASQAGIVKKSGSDGSRTHVVGRSQTKGSYRRLQRSIPFFQEAQLLQIQKAG